MLDIDNSHEVQSWSDVLEVMEMILDDCKTIKSSLEILYEDVKKIPHGATRRQYVSLLHFLNKYKRTFSCMEDYTEFIVHDSKR